MILMENDLVWLEPLPEIKLAISFSILHSISLGFMALRKQEECATQKTTAQGQGCRKSASSITTGWSPNSVMSELQNALNALVAPVPAHKHGGNTAFQTAGPQK